MSIGVGIFLIAVGAILAFGIRGDDGWAVNLTVVGVVVMLAGAAGIWLSYKITNDRRRVPTDAIDPAVEEQYRTVEADHEHHPHHTRIEHHPEGKPARSAPRRGEVPADQAPAPTEPMPAAEPAQSEPRPAVAEQPTQVEQTPVEAAAPPREASAAPQAERPAAADGPTERTIDLDPAASGLPEQPTRPHR